MLRNNLSTRPFYNERGVRAGLMALGVLALALTFFNAVEILRLRAQDSEARDTVARNDAQARELRAQAQTIRASIDQARLKVVEAAASEANGLIDRRTFSWTELLNQFQVTLPPDVRIGNVTPQADADGRLMVQMFVMSRRIEDLEEFMNALADTGRFSGVISRADRPDADGTLLSQVQAYYAPAAPPSPGASAGQAVQHAPSSEAEKGGSGNQSAPANVSPGVPQ